MGKLFGELAVVRGIVYYRLSPHELKPFAGCISRGLPNVIPRTLGTVIYWLPIFITAATIFETMEKAHKIIHRKNPADYVDEVDPNKI